MQDQAAPAAAEQDSRRGLLRRAAAGTLAASSLLVAGCGSGRSGQASVKHAARPVRSADITMLDDLLDLERRTVAAYTAGIPLLLRSQVKTAQQFLAEELEHTGELLALIKAAGGQPVARRASYDLGHPVTPSDVLTLLHSLERAQIVAYVSAIPRLSPGPVRAAVATILTSDAQHIAVLRLAQHQAPMPSPLVSGHE
jgi:hypothetical protein